MSIGLRRTYGIILRLRIFLGGVIITSPRMCYQIYEKREFLRRRFQDYERESKEDI